jgi:hypothetical protein
MSFYFSPWNINIPGAFQSKFKVMFMFKFFNMLTAVFVLGLVDQVEDGIAVVELSTSNGDISYSSIPVFLFPCKVSEGDFFYFSYADGVTEIRCGEPPE